MIVSELLRTIVFAVPARRISTSDRVPSGFTRKRTVFPVNFIPLFTQTPRAVAMNWPSLHNVTWTLELLDSSVSWYIPWRISAPFMIKGACRKKGRAGFFLAGSGKLAASKMNVLSAALLIFIYPPMRAAECLSVERSLVRCFDFPHPQHQDQTQIGCQPNWRAIQIGPRANLDSNAATSL